jgi:acyl-ACP thioesterase
MAKRSNFSELVPEPSAGRVFERELRPGIADVSRSGRARLDAIARWLQDAAYADLVDAGFEGRGAWIVRRTRLRVEAFPRFGDDLTLRTFCSGIGRFSAERRTDVTSAGGARVQAVALWICLDPEAGRPMRFPEDFVAAYAPSANGRDANVRLRHPDPPPDAGREPWRFRAIEVDAAGHVNNSHYWVPLEEDLAAGPEPEVIDAEVEYRDPAQPGEVVVLRQGRSRWIASPAGELHASVLVG